MIVRNPLGAVFCISACGLFCVGCASYRSTSIAANGVLKDGLVYFLPKRPIIVQVVVTADPKDPKGQIETPSLVAADVVPDYEYPFVLTMSTNWVSDNHLTLAVSKTGLLQTSNSTVTSGINTVFENLAKAAGTVQGGLMATGKTTPLAPKASDDCKVGQTYNLILWAGTVADKGKQGPLCGFYVNVTSVFGGSNLKSNKRSDQTDAPKPGVPGVFYRTEIPYQVTLNPLDSAKPTIAYVTSAPDLSPTAFLPIKRALFANNTAAITMKDGELTNFDQDSPGELVGLTTLPATVIGAYFSAISNIIPKRVSATNSQMALALSNLQQQRCQAALVANPITSKSSPSEQDTAVANIKAACAAAAVPAASP